MIYGGVALDEVGRRMGKYAWEPEIFSNDLYTKMFCVPVSIPTEFRQS